MFLCEYTFRFGEKCQEPVIEGSRFCVLHTPFPEDAEDPEYQRLREMKEEKTKEKVNLGDFNFEGAILYSFDLPVKTEGDINFNKVLTIQNANFENAEIGGDVWFIDTKIGGNALFENAKINGNAVFNDSQIGKDVLFVDAKIGGDLLFEKAKIDRNAVFIDAEVSEGAWFRGAHICKNVEFIGAKISRNAAFVSVEIGGDAVFLNLEIGGFAIFKNALFSCGVDIIPIYVKGIIDFRDAKFSSPKAQENACRVAKNQCIKFGDNHEADNYFYREMEGKRKQKLEIFRWPEYVLVQLIFGYGVRPLRTFCIWFLFILTFAIIYFGYQTLDPGSEFIEYFYFSTTTAMTPGFGGYKISPAWQGLALVEAFFGTFMWAAFITIFARKYMR